MVIKFTIISSINGLVVLVWLKESIKSFWAAAVRMNDIIPKGRLKYISYVEYFCSDFFKYRKCNKCFK